MSDSVDRVFVHALNTVKRIPRTGTARPPAAERLKLYGLYKQSMEGDVKGVMDRPVGNTADVYMECEKWDAWFAQRGLTRTEAKRRYISTLIDTMHRYASQTPEARELAVELEFVWDQIKSNPSSSSSSSPIQRAGVPSLPQHSYPSITGRLARNDYVDHMIARNQGMGGGDSRLRVLSPVSQPDGHYRGRGADSDVDGDEDDAEEFAEARDQLYDDNEDDEDGDDGDDRSTRQEKSVSDDEMEEGVVDYDDERSRESSLWRRGRRDNRHREAEAAARSSNDGKPRDTRKWRRRVEQALTKMTAEIAAVREQMEVRDLARRRRSKIWAWLKWIVWVTLRQVIWDLAILAMLLIYLRLRGDRRVEDKLRLGWSEVKTRLSKLRSIRRSPRTPLLP